MFDAYLADYLQHLSAKGYTQGTRYWHGCYLKQFTTWLTSRGVTDFLGVTTVMVENYLVYLREERRNRKGEALADSTCQSHAAAISGLYGWLEKNGHVLLNPAPVERQKKPRSVKLPRVMTEEEALSILESCPINTPVGLRDRAILEMLYSTGIRRSELANLNLQDFSPDRGELAIIQGKGSKDRVTPIGEYACAYTQGYLQLIRPWQVGSTNEEALFVSSQDGGRLSLGTVNYLVEKAARRARVKKRITPHTFRHSMATHLLRNKADLRHIQAILGHSSVATTQVYTHLAFEDLKETIRQAHPRGRR